MNLNLKPLMMKYMCVNNINSKGPGHILILSWRGPILVVLGPLVPNQLTDWLYCQIYRYPLAGNTGAIGQDLFALNQTTAFITNQTYPNGVVINKTFPSRRADCLRVAESGQLQFQGPYLLVQVRLDSFIRSYLSSSERTAEKCRHLSPSKEYNSADCFGSPDAWSAV